MICQVLLQLCDYCGSVVLVNFKFMNMFGNVNKHMYLYHVIPSLCRLMKLAVDRLEQILFYCCLDCDSQELSEILIVSQSIIALLINTNIILYVLVSCVTVVSCHRTCHSTRMKSYCVSLFICWEEFTLLKKNCLKMQVRHRLVVGT